MWRNGKGLVYLEPGEVAALAALARQAVPTGPATHPRELMFAALGEVLGDVIDGPGVVLALAPESVVRQAARAYVRSDDASASLPRASGGSKSVRLA